MTISAGQLRAARGLVGWSQSDLAEAAKIGRATIADFESGKRIPYVRTLEELRASLEAAGIEFTNGARPGVRLSPVGVLHQLADEANLDAILNTKGMKEEVGHSAEAGKTLGLSCAHRSGLNATIARELLLGLCGSGRTA